MSIFPWLNEYPGRPIKKRFAKAPRPVPYYGSPYQYINLPKPQDIPVAMWENILKDFDQALRFRYEEITAPKIETIEEEFQEQPGAVGISITADPRKYLSKGLAGVFDDTWRNWLKSVISWSDLDIMVEQRNIWRPLARGQNGGPAKGLPGLLEETAPNSNIFKGADRANFDAYNAGIPNFDPGREKSLYESLASDIEQWARYGKSKVGRAGRWSMVEMDLLNAIRWDAFENNEVLLSTPAYAHAKAFLDEFSKARGYNNWVFVSGKKKSSFGSTESSPLYGGIEAAGNYKDALKAIDIYGFNSGNDNLIFDFKLRHDLAEKLQISLDDFDRLKSTSPNTLISKLKAPPLSTTIEKVAGVFGGGVKEADINALSSAADLDALLDKGLYNQLKSFYGKKASLIGGMQFTLENDFISDYGGKGRHVPFNVRKAAISKHKEIRDWADGKTEEVRRKLESLYEQLETDATLRTQLRTLMGTMPDGKGGDIDRLDVLLEWRQLLKFREDAFRMQDFLDALGDDTLFRTYVWLGRASRDLPEWLGDWKRRMQYLTPQFYVEGIFGYLDRNLLGISSTGKNRLIFRLFENGAYVPVRGVEMYLKAKDFEGIWDVHKKITDLFEEQKVVGGTTISAALKRDLLKGSASLDFLETAGEITGAQKKAYIDFLNSKIYHKLTDPGKGGVSFVNKDNLDAFFSTLKGKLGDESHMYAGLSVKAGRYLDHEQDVLTNWIFTWPVVGNVARQYANLFKMGNVKFARFFRKSVFGKAFRRSSIWFKGVARGKITKGAFAKVFGSKVMQPIAKLLGNILGAAGGIIGAVVAWVGFKLFSDVLNLLRGKPAKETKKAASKLVKIVLGLSLACLSPILLLLFIMLFIIGGILDQAGRVSQAVTIGGIFDRLAVEKTVTFDSAARSLNYVITITNRSSDDQLVTLVSDDIKTIPEDCSLGVIDPKNNASLGHIVYVDPPDGVVHRKSLKSGETIKIKYSLVGIPNTLTNATVINVASLEIPPKTGVGASDTGSVTNTYTFGKGGCVSNIGVDAIADVLSSCLVMVPKAPAPSHDLDTTSPYWPYDSYRKFDMACVTGTGLLSNPKCQAAFSTYYSAGSTYYPDWLQCTAFANIALGCFGGSDYYMSGNANTWLNEAMVYARHGMKFEAYNTGTGRPPLPGSVLVFSGGSFGHVGVVTSVSGAGGSYAVTLKNANLGSVEYHLLFDSNGNLKNPDALPGLTYLGFFKIK